MSLELTKAKAYRLIELQNEAAREAQTQCDKLDQQIKRYARSLITLTELTQQLMDATLEIAEITQQNNQQKQTNQ